MDEITSTVRKNREEALSIGDYNQYRKSCAGKLLQLRRKLKIVTPKGRKFEPKKVDAYLKDTENATQWQHYLLFSAERAWAHAMQVKSLHTPESGDSSIAGPTRSHIISRLVKAVKMAKHLVALTQQSFGNETQLASAAYHSSLEGSLDFESQKWEQCLRAFSASHVIYSALGLSKKTNAYDDWVSDNIEPSVRYAAYQQRLPRTLSVPKVVARFVPQDSEFVQKALQVSPSAIAQEQTKSSATSETAPEDLPTTISWRGRTVKLEDARVAQAIGAARSAENEVQQVIAGSATSQEKAAVFESILTPSQDAVDATKTAIDELLSEGVARSDARIQSLEITRTAVNYDLIGWRIGRNRVLCGPDDGASFQAEPSRKPKSRRAKAAGEKEDNATSAQEEGIGRKLARLRERVVLYDSTIQSIESVRELAGVAADSSLLKKLVSRKGYFNALRSLAVARSHALQGNNKNALALLSRAAQHASVMDTFDDDEPEVRSKIPRHFLTSAQAQSLRQMLQDLVQRFRALVEMDNLQAEAVRAEKTKSAWVAPLIERLDEYPAGGADLQNLVTYPPKLRPVPVKPIFLDLAWNYIQYPREAAQGVKVAPNASTSVEEGNSKTTKKGWFGFGRS